MKLKRTIYFSCFLAITVILSQCDKIEQEPLLESENTKEELQNYEETNLKSFNTLLLNVDLAENASRTGFPHPMESDNGWGGGSDKWDIVDGNRSYSNWANGLAFTGGTQPYVAPCGWRQATINFGQLVNFNHIIVWHHGDVHIPNIYKIQYWDGSNWIDVLSTSTGLDYVRWDLRTTSGAGSVPTENIFPEVISSKVRFMIHNCDIGHGWIYELEVYLSVVEVELDIKPGSDTNPINLKSKGVIPVAILTTDDFDATTVDYQTVKFGPNEASIAHKKGHIEDVDGDGDLDFVLHFKTLETGIVSTDTEATLTGETYDGTPFFGTDLISILADD